jgi:TolB protein
VAAEVFATYARLPVHELYHVSDNGRAAGAGRALVFLNWPTALAAIPILAVVAAEARSRTISRLAVLAVVLCAAVFWPRIVEQVDLDAKWWNAIAAVGVLLAFVLTVVVLVRRGPGMRTRAPGDRIRVVAAVGLLLIALPWIAADLGFMIGRWPLLGSIFYSDEWYAGFGHARVGQAVHPGNHHGMAGTLLALTAIVLSRTLGSVGPQLQRVLGAYLAILLLYGLANVANDFWLEQIVKRGVTDWQVPSMIVPAPNVPWLILLILATVLYVFVFGRMASATPTGRRRLGWPVALLPVVVALLVIGLAHGATHHVTTHGAADRIAFAYAPEGTSHIFVTRGNELVQLTDSDYSELAPAWSPDHRRIAFQSNRDGNWEIYVASADGSDVRRLTDDDSRDGEPSWSPDGKRIAFVRDGHLYEMQANGHGAHGLENDGEWPAWSRDGRTLAFEVEFGDHYHGIATRAPGGGLGSYGPVDDRRPVWSPNGNVLAYQCRRGEHWHICLLDPESGSQRVLTGDDSDAFAPAWSPDGKRIAFISDRDGRDQLFVMRANGASVVRLTSGQFDKDTPSWGR